MVAASATITIITTIIHSYLPGLVFIKDPLISNESFRAEIISYLFLVLSQDWCMVGTHEIFIGLYIIRFLPTIFYE